MGPREPNVWHQVHAQREDGVAAMFLIRDVEPRADQPKIFVVELPYAVTDLSGQPDASGYRRLGAFQEQWLEPACAALGWTFVAWKSEDGSFFLYLYGAGDPEILLEKLAPFDGELGFFNDVDADWSEYAALRELVEQSEAEGDDRGGHEHVHGDGCDHDHDDPDHHHDHDHNHHHERGLIGGAIQVIDLTGEPTRSSATRPIRKPVQRTTAGKPAKRAASKPAATTRPTKRAAASKPAARAKPAKRAAASKPAATAKRTARSSQSTPTKPAAKPRRR